MDRAFRRAVLDRLGTLDDMASHAGTSLPLSVARTEIRRITKGWRVLLTEHQPDAAGRCPVCSGGWRRRKWPCQVWVTAHQRLIGATTEVPQPRSSLGVSFRRPPRHVKVVVRRAETSPEASIPAPQEPDTVPIHRAAVIERPPAMPRPRLARRAGRPGR